MDDRARIFEQHRARMCSVAYRMLGSRSDAEDVVQDAYLRWHRASIADIRSVEAWLVTVVTRLSIDRLRQAKAARESYVGPWLPEPLVNNEAPPADAQSELASSLSVAFLVVLERLAPEERAAFLLHEVFESGYDEISGILGKSEVACRQLVSRARKRVHELPATGRSDRRGVRRPGTVSAGTASAGTASAAARPAAVSRYRCRLGRPGTGSSSHSASSSPRSASRIRMGYRLPDFSPVSLATA